MTQEFPSKFFEKNLEERLQIIKNFCGLTEKDLDVLKSKNGGIDFERANQMVENAIGIFSYPLGIANNFVINNKSYLVPMVIEEPSVIAAASKGAKIAKSLGGFTAKADDSISIGQIQVLGVNPSEAIEKLKKITPEILEVSNSKSKTLQSLGKGAKEVRFKEIATSEESMLIVELLVDVGDAMGANITNSMCEAVAPLIEKETGGRILLRILSNYSTERMVHCTATFDKNLLGGDEVVNNVILAYQFAAFDEYRAVTHNKGVMNGIIGVASAVGQDTRAIEAAANAYASRNGKYTSLTKWEKDNSGNLKGSISIPLSVGIVGGIINVHPTVKACLDLLGVSSAQELSCIIASVGLAQNFSAIFALATDGIQKGHMKLHARNLAAAAGANQDQIKKVVDKMVLEGNISLNRAKEILREL